MSDELTLHSAQLPTSMLGTSASSSLQVWALTLLRAVAGFTHAIYGAQLLFGRFGGSGPHPAFTLLWFAGVLEFFGGLLLGVGLFTRPVAFILSGESIRLFLSPFSARLEPSAERWRTCGAVLLYLSLPVHDRAGPDQRWAARRQTKLDI